MGTPLISVIIPTYNRAQMLSDALDSVCAQTVTDLEVVVVDDGSSDETETKVEMHARLDGRIRYSRIDHSGFPGAVRNRGVDKSQGRFIAFLDSDDLWLPEKLEQQLPLLVQRGYRICHTRERWMRSGKEISQQGQKHKREGDLYPDSLLKCIIGPSTVILERGLFEASGGFREDIEIAEDYELWLRITPVTDVGYADEQLTIKRAGHSGQLSEKYGRIEYFRIQALAGLVDSGFFSSLDDVREGCAKLAATELARKCRIYALGAQKRGKTAEAYTYNQLAGKYDTFPEGEGSGRKRVT